MFSLFVSLHREFCTTNTFAYSCMKRAATLRLSLITFTGPRIAGFPALLGHIFTWGRGHHLTLSGHPMGENVDINIHSAFPLVTKIQK